MKYLSATFAIIALLAVLILGAKWCLESNVRASFVYCVDARFEKLPDNDDRLTEWLKQQPGIVAHTVAIRRFGERRDLVEVGFIQVQTISRDPAFPDLDTKCADLGYEKPDARFRDCEDRQR